MMRILDQKFRRDLQVCMFNELQKKTKRLQFYGINVPILDQTSCVQELNDLWIS